MKKYKLGVCCFVIMAAILAIGTTFALADEKDVVESLICQRTDTLNGFYSGDISRKDAIEIIESIETSFLLEEDLKNIDRYFQTDIEHISDYSISYIKIKEVKEDMIAADVTMDWSTEGIDGSDNFSCTYNVICSKEKNVYKLLQFF